VSRRRERHRQAGIGGANAAVLEQAVKFRGDKADAQGQEELVRLGRRPAPKRNFALAPVGKRRSLRCTRGICENMAAALGMGDLAWLCAAAKRRSWKGSHELEERRSAGRREILAIGRDHLSDARLYADRRHMIDSVGPEKSCNFYLSAL